MLWLLTHAGVGRAPSSKSFCFEELCAPIHVGCRRASHGFGIWCECQNSSYPWEEGYTVVFHMFTTNPKEEKSHRT